MITRIVAFILIVFLSPLILVLAITSVIMGQIPVIFKAGRLGKDKKIFTIYKFSTLANWKKTQFEDYLRNNPEQKLEWEKYGKLYNDPRASKYGIFLRRSSLDEIPQLWNVVKGEMALVGPRPIDMREDAIYGKYSSLLHSVKPGMTGLWQVSGRNTIPYRRRIAINLYYVKHKSMCLDLWIIYKTVWAVLSGRGAF